MTRRPPEAVVLSIGEELLDGRILDRNSAWLARELGCLGVEVRRMLTVGDLPGELRRVLTELDGAVPLVVSTGGLGPTEDDRVRAEAAAHAGVGLEDVPGAVERLDALWRRQHEGAEPPPWFLDQGRVPEGATPLGNAAGTAWGFALTLPGGTLYVALPGPPTEAAAAWGEGGGRAALGDLASHPEAPVVGTFHTAGAPESVVEARVRDLMGPGNPCLGITASPSGVSLSVRARPRPEAGQSARDVLEETARLLQHRLADLLWGRDDQTLAGVVVRALAERGASVATAESCTGGRLAAAITGVPGASEVFHFGWVTYANAAKERELGVPHETLQRVGAVSREVAVAMAEGARRASGADWALSVTGIAGPSGGTPEKPVGLVYLGCAGPDGAFAVERRQWARGGRESVQLQSVRDSLDLLRRELLGLPRLPDR